jgi:hypothetical protein
MLQEAERNGRYSTHDPRRLVRQGPKSVEDEEALGKLPDQSRLGLGTMTVSRGSRYLPFGKSISGASCPVSFSDFRAQCSCFLNAIDLRSGFLSARRQRVVYVSTSDKNPWVRQKGGALRTGDCTTWRCCSVSE